MIILLYHLPTFLWHASSSGSRKQVGAWKFCGGASFDAVPRQDNGAIGDDNTG